MEQTKKYPAIDWTKNEYHQLQLVVDALKAICAREDKRHMMDAHLDYDPTPNEPGEPPITAYEMHTAAWQEHQEMHR
jgi:hypothetical protein